MNENRIAAALGLLFEKHRIVFWYDVKKELREDFEALSLPDIEKLELNNNEYGIKYRLLREPPDRKFLLYRERMAEIFETSADNISLHLKIIYNDGELDESATAEESSVVRQEGRRQVTRRINHYNLDAIISVGYRVNSRRAVQLRQWARRFGRDQPVISRHLDNVFMEGQLEKESNMQKMHIANSVVFATVPKRRIGARSNRCKKCNRSV